MWGGVVQSEPVGYVSSGKFAFTENRGGGGGVTVTV